MILIGNDLNIVEEFENLLSITKKLILSKYTQSELANLNGVSFETIVYQEMILASKDSLFENKIEHTGVQMFPDIIVPTNKLGVEVKFTTSDKWESVGNSILETTRRKDIDRIYIFFGKIGGEPDIKYSLYQDCLSDIIVTHSPRYKINMSTSPGHSIFHRMKVNYNEFRKNEPIKRARNYYKSQLKEGEALWWLDTDSLEQSQPVIIKSFAALSNEVKEKFRAECMVLFPEIFKNSNDKYARATIYLMKKYNAICPNMRDIFSGGGQQTIALNSGALTVPRVIFELYLLSSKIEEVLRSVDIYEVKGYWENDSVTKENLESEWLNLVFQSSGVNIKEIYGKGLDKD